jgi:hypothetical protein
MKTIEDRENEKAENAYFELNHIPKMKGAKASP